MRALLSLLPRSEGRLLLAFLALCCFSLAILWSVTEPIGPPYENLDPVVAKGVFLRQLLWVLIGCAALVLATRVPLRQLEDLAWPLFLALVLLLVLVLVAGPVVAGARRWLIVGPFRLQPSELAKIGFIVLCAQILTRGQARKQQWWPVLLSLGMCAVVFLLVWREPDLGTSLVFPALWLGMIFWFGLSGEVLLGVVTALLSAVISFYSESVLEQPWPWGVYLVVVIGLLYLGRFKVLSSGAILLGNIATGIGIPFLWDRLQEYQQDRIMAFFKPTEDAFGSGYQIIQSKVAIGSGGLFGTHYLQGTQKGLAFLPERHTDFIFSVVGEELGFAGAMILLAIFLVIILRALALAQSARRPFPSFLAVGVATYLAFHVVVNVAITSGLLPVTGLPLPLISYGGSNLLTSSFLLGLLINIGDRQYET